MYFPKAWFKAEGDFQAPDKRDLKLEAWGWGEDEESARTEAMGRLARLLERVKRGDRFPDHYAYASRPLREEVVETFGDRAVITRNRHGALVLNTARMLFLDIDFKPEGIGQWLARLVKRTSVQEAALAKLRSDLSGKGAFRIYRTAAGFRVICIDREFDPAGPEAETLMMATGTDPAFIRLCKVQKSFRARLTPKAWRCNFHGPPGEHPRTDPKLLEHFEKWLAEYGKVCGDYATCRFIEAAGKPAFGSGIDDELVALHDRLTGTSEKLALA